MAVMNGRCRCGNSDPMKFWVLRNENNDETFGVCCKNRSCNSEYLIERFIHGNQGDGNPGIIFNYIPLDFKGQTNVNINTDYQIDLNRIHITRDNLGDLRRGDHIAFSRLSGIVHHAVVVSVQDNPLSISVIQWGKRDGKWLKSSIHEETLTEEHFRKCYKINYSEEQNQQNPPDLVIARAMSRLAPEETTEQFARPFVFDEYSENYGFLNQNCEDLAMYCKLGCVFMHSRQLAYLMSQVKKALWSNASKVFITEILENIVQFLTENSGYLELLGFSAVVVTELISLKSRYDYLKAERMKPVNPITEEVYKEELQKKVLECVVTILLYGGVGASLFLAGCPLLLEVIFSVVLLLLCRTLFPQLLSRFIDWWFDVDSALVTYLSHLQDMFLQMSIDLRNLLVPLRPAVA